MKPNPKVIGVAIEGDGIVVTFADGGPGRYSAELLASITSENNGTTSLARTLHLLNEARAASFRQTT